MKNLTTIIILTLTVISFNSCKLQGLGGEDAGNLLGESCGGQGMERGESNENRQGQQLNCNINIPNKNIANKPAGFIAPIDSVTFAGFTYHECRDALSNPALCRNGAVFHQFSGSVVILKSFKLNPTATKICFLGDGFSYTATSVGVVAKQACL